MRGPIYVPGHDTQNIGDTIQSLALLQELPTPVEFLDRDRIDSQSFRSDGFLIANGWWMMATPTRRFNFPPPPTLNTFFVACHFTPTFFDALDSHQLQYLSDRGPIGCRDHATVELCHSRGIEAVWTGCVTMLLRPGEVERTQQVAVVDINDEAFGSLPTDIRRDSVRLTHYFPPPGRVDNTTERFKLRYSRWLIEEYARSRLVVTSRLHAALPALAARTPVVLIFNDQNDKRFGAVDDLLRVHRTGKSIEWNPTVPDLEPYARPLRNLLREAVRLRGNPLRGSSYPNDFR